MKKNSMFFVGLIAGGLLCFLIENKIPAMMIYGGLMYIFGFVDSQTAKKV